MSHACSGGSHIKPSRPDNEALHQIALALAQETLPEGWELVSSGVHQRTARAPGLALFYKEFAAPSPLRRLGMHIAAGPALRSDRQQQALRLAGFSAPTVIARGQLPQGREYFFSDILEGDELGLWLSRSLGGRDPATLRLKRELLQAIGSWLGHLHTCGFHHGQLSADNILVAYRGGRFHFSLTGNQDGRLRRPPSGRDLLRDLSELCRSLNGSTTRSDLWRIFLAWRQQHPELGHLEARVLASQAWRRARQAAGDRRSCNQSATSPRTSRRSGSLKIS